MNVTELMELQDNIDDLQKTIFSNFSRSSNNECRIAALVPLVEESYGIYLFITSMMKAMHQNQSLSFTFVWQSKFDNAA